MNSKNTKFNFEYELSKISSIRDNKQRLNAFNNYMDRIFISTAKGDVEHDLEDIILQKQTSEHLLNFLYTFGENWNEIKKSINKEDYKDLSTALKYSLNTMKYSALCDNEFYLPPNISLNLIKSLELDEQKENFLNSKQLSKFGFESLEAKEILSSLKYDERKVNYLINKHNEIYLGLREIVDVINSLLYDINKIRFLDLKICKIFDFSNVELTSIINHLNTDTSKLKALSIVSKEKPYKLSDEQIGSILSHLNQDKTKMSFLTSSSLSKLLETNDKDTIRTIALQIVCSLQFDKNKLKILEPENSKNLGLKNLNKVLIANSLQFDINKVQIIEKASELGFNSKNLSRIIASMNSEKTKIKYLNSFNFSPSEKARIISSFNDIHTLKQYINSKEIEPFKYAILLGMYDRKESISKHDFDEVAMLAGINLKDLDSLLIPVLPNGMTIGVELETIGLNEKGNFNATLFKEFRTVLGNFLAKRDTSLKGYNGHDGVEIISPILMNHNLKNLVLVATLLQKNDLGINETCGAHIHIGADYLDSTEAWKNLCEIWGNNEDIIYQISTPKGTVLRNGVEEYARPISPKLVEYIKSGKINLENENGIDRLINAIKYLQYGPNSEFPHMFIRHPELDANAMDFHKYYGLNFKNVNTINKNTIEYRLPNGTVDAQVLMNNIRLFSSIVDVSKQLGDIEIAIKQEMNLTARQKKLYLAREALINANPQNTGERLSTLMNLLFDGNPAIQQIYIDRYSEYSKDTLEKFKFDRFGYRKFYYRNSQNIGKVLAEILNTENEKDNER